MIPSINAVEIAIVLATGSAALAVGLWTMEYQQARRLEYIATITDSDADAGTAKVLPSARMPDNIVWTPPPVLVLELLWVAIERGAPLPRACDAVGIVIGGPMGAGLCRAARGLLSGLSWHDAWSVPCARTNRSITRKPRRGGNRPRDSGTKRIHKAHNVTIDETCDTLRLVRDTLEPSWTQGVRAGPRLRAVIEQLDSTERMRVERRSRQLSVRLLLPTGLCFLPAFLCIAVIPTIASFAMTM